MKLGRGLEFLIGEQGIHEHKLEREQQSPEKSELVSDRSPREITVNPLDCGLSHKTLWHQSKPSIVLISYKRR